MEGEIGPVFFWQAAQPCCWVVGGVLLALPLLAQLFVVACFCCRMSDDREFPLQGVVCKAESDWRVRVGMNLPKAQRFPVKITVGETREQAVLRHPRFQAAVVAAREAGELIHGFGHYLTRTAKFPAQIASLSAD